MTNILNKIVNEPKNKAHLLGGMIRRYDPGLLSVDDNIYTIIDKICHLIATASGRERLAYLSEKMSRHYGQIYLRWLMDFTNDHKEIIRVIRRKHEQETEKETLSSVKLRTKRAQ